MTLIVSLGTFALFAKVGNLGGQIRHSEIRTNTTAFQNTTENQKIYRHEEHEEEDD